MENLHAIPIPSGLKIVNSFWEIIERWHAQEPALDWNSVLSLFPPELGSLPGQIRHLGLINCFQWHLEDACRANYTSQHILAQLKIDVDRSNQRRTQLIDALDQMLLQALRRLRPEPKAARLALVTPGNLIDSLSILVLKHYHAGQWVPQDASGSSVVALLEERIMNLYTGFDTLMDDLVKGQQRLKVYPTIKVYSSMTTSKNLSHREPG